MRGTCTSSFASSARGTGHARRANRGLSSARMRMGYFCLLALIVQHAAGVSNAIADQTQSPGESSKSWYGLEIGPTFSLPVPAASASRSEIGLDVGLSCTAKTAPMLGVGVTFSYHYWPVSGEFKTEFNEFLGRQTLETLKLGGGTWGLQVVQFGVHFRVAAPSTRNVRPWLQVGLSTYGVDPNISGYSGDAGFFTVTAPPMKRTQSTGFSGAVGIDLLGGHPARMGLDATYHYVNCSEFYGQDLQVFTLGAHALFDCFGAPP